MNKSKAYTQQFVIALMVIHSIYLALFFFDLIHLKSLNAFVINASSIAIFLLGLLIIAPSIKKDSETFTIKFLLLTTVQMLLFMLGIIIILFGDLEGKKITGFHFTGIFMSCLFVQSVLLVKLKNNN